MCESLKLYVPKSIKISGTDFCYDKLLYRDGKRGSDVVQMLAKANGMSSEELIKKYDLCVYDDYDMCGDGNLWNEVSVNEEIELIRGKKK
jgi:hypothetical protein